MKYFLRRTFAYFIDCSIAYLFVMLIIQWAILSQLRVYVGITEVWFQSSINMHLYVFSSISFPVYLYFAYFDSRHSKGTFGKRLCKLRVNDIKNHKISFLKSFWRAILKLLPWEIAHLGIIHPTPVYFENEPNIRILTYIGLLLFTVYFISIWFSSKQQTIYDKVVGTLVLDLKPIGNS